MEARHADAGELQLTAPAPIRRTAGRLRETTLIHRAAALQRSLPVTAPLRAAQVGWARGVCPPTAQLRGENDSIGHVGDPHSLTSSLTHSLTHSLLADL